MAAETPVEIRPMRRRAPKGPPERLTAWRPGPTNLQEFCELTAAAFLLGVAIGAALFVVTVGVFGWVA
jgi:hypothetical protein